jgi:hypothetical protein
MSVKLCIPSRSARRRWTVAAAAAALVLGATAQAQAIAAPTGRAAAAPAPAANAATAATAAKSQSAAGSPAYYDSGLDPTPYMGWNTYYGIGGPTQSGVEVVADYLISSGLAKAGYDYVWLDGGWQAAAAQRAGRAGRQPDRVPRGHPGPGQLAARARPQGRHLHRRRGLQQRDLRPGQRRPLPAGRGPVRRLEGRRDQGRLPLRDRRGPEPGPVLRAVQRRRSPSRAGRCC